MKNARAKLVVLCTVDENGKRIFGDADIVVVDKSANADHLSWPGPVAL